jgi:hypothetical protein
VPLFAPTIDSTPPGKRLCRMVFPLSFGPFSSASSKTIFARAGQSRSMGATSSFE